MMDTDAIQEAVVVGALLVPVYAIVHDVVKDTRLVKEGNRDLLAVFLSGLIFHAVAEGSGLNEWYIKNGGAVRKWMSSMNKRKDVDDWSGSNDARVCPLAVRSCQDCRA
jgi:hypothetical protein